MEETDHALMVPIKPVQPVHKKADLGLRDLGFHEAQEFAGELKAVHSNPMPILPFVVMPHIICHRQGNTEEMPSGQSKSS
ncbi:hypothetical protein DHEL01_v202566 [Diaporthe helianthi]|uniref:Uncharacterized protein n=1 Tax=Diaporthe helianthi TaxID=158607 RepID=A0A2P5I975_DIAHE|nr:hypothetical protein DHEL01_v202566 [Diaporthe helianthi]